MYKKKLQDRFASVLLSISIGIGTVAAPVLFVPASATGQSGSQTEAAAEREALPAEDIISLEPSSAEFLIRAGKGSGKTIPMSLERSKDQQGLWILTFDGLYNLSIHRTAEGVVQVTRMALLDKNQAITFNPPIDLIPDRIMAGLQIRTSGTAKVFDLETGEETRQGTYSHTIEGLRRANFDTPVGMIDGYLILYESRINFDLATLLVELESGWSKDKKLVYWRTRIDLEKLLGLFGETTTRELVLADRNPGSRGRGP